MESFQVAFQISKPKLLALATTPSKDLKSRVFGSSCILSFQSIHGSSCPICFATKWAGLPVPVINGVIEALYQ